MTHSDRLQRSMSYLLETATNLLLFSIDISMGFTSCLPYCSDIVHRRPNQTLHDVWPSPGLVHYIYTFSGAFAPWLNFARCKLHFASKSCVLLYWDWQHYCTALDQWASAKLCGVVQGMELRNFSRGRHLYSAGQPSRWTWAHILVVFLFLWFSADDFAGSPSSFQRILNISYLIEQ